MSARIDAKEREEEERQVRRSKKRKGIEAERPKLPTPSWEIDALIGQEEQNGKGKRKKKKQGAVPQLSYPEPISHLLRCAGTIR